MSLPSLEGPLLGDITLKFPQHQDKENIAKLFRDKEKKVYRYWIHVETTILNKMIAN